MIRLIGRNTLRALVSLTVAFPLLFSIGCADIITHSNSANSEGMALYRQRLYGDAAGAFRNSIRQDPRNYKSHFYLGVCYDELSHSQRAISQYRMTLDVMNHSSEGRTNTEFREVVLDSLASAIARHDQQEVELSATERAARETNSCENWFLLAKVYRLRGDADSAIDAYRSAAKADPTAFAVRKEFGLYLLEPLNQHREAEYYLRQANDLKPGDDAVVLALQRLGVSITRATPLKTAPANASASPVRQATVAAPRE